MFDSTLTIDNCQVNQHVVAYLFTDEVSVVEEMEVMTRDADNITADSTSEDRKSSHGSSSSGNLQL